MLQQGRERLDAGAPESEIKSILEQAAQIDKQLQRAKSLAKNEEAVWLNEYIGMRDYQNRLNYDLEAARKDLELLEIQRNNVEYSRTVAVNTHGNGIEEYNAQLDALDKQISEKKREMVLAERVQNAYSFSSVTSNDDFDRMSRYTGAKNGSDYEILDHRATVLQAEYNRTGDQEIWEELMAVQEQMAGKDGSDHSAADAIYTILNSSEEEWGGILNNESPRSMAHSYFKNLEFITDEEISVFNYWYNKSGGDKAMEYLDSLQEALNYRAAEKRFEAYEDKWALEMLFGIEAGLDQFGSGIKNLFTGGDDYIAPSSTQILSGMVRKDLGDNGPKLPEWLGGSSLGQVGYDFITTSANMAPSILTSAALSIVNPTVGAVAGNTLMGASAAGNAYAEKINLGYSEDEARTYGLLVGSSEATLQYLLGGIGKLGGNGLSKVAINNLDKVDTILARVAKSTGGKIFLNGVSEGFEEGLQAILEPYLWQAVSGEEGSVNWEETLYSSLLGFVTGGVFESPGAIVQSAGQNIGYYKTGADIRSAGGTDALMALANEVAGVAPANMQNAIQKQSSKVDKKATSRRVGKLYDTVQSATSQADISQSLQTKGFSKETANDIAAAVIASNNGQDLSSSQRKLLKLVEKNSVAREAIASAMSSPQSSVGQKMRAFQSGVVRGNVTEAASAQLGKGGNITEGNLTTAAETAAEGRYEVAEGGKTIDGDGNVISITGISSIDKGRVVLQTEDGKTVDAGEVSYGSQDEALVYEAVANLEGIIDGETATKLAKHLLKLGNASSNVYVNGIVQAYTYGYYGYGREAMIGKNTLSATLSEEQRNVAYGLAEQYRAAKTDADQKAAASEKKTGGKKAGKVHFNGNRNSLTERQSASLKAIGKIADVLGIQVYVFESKLGKNGRRIGANGWYDPKDGSIHIDLHAGANGEGTMIFTMAHELPHFVRQWSPAKFKILADFLMQEYGKKGVSVDALVREQQAKAKRTGRTISYDTAYEEVVADSMEAMLSDGKVMEKLAKLKAQDADLWQKIKDYISKLAEKIRMAYKGLAPDSVEGRYVAEMKDAVERFQELFTEGLTDASENFQSAEKNTTPEGGAMYSLRAFDDGTRFVDVQMNATTFDGMTVSQMNKKAKSILMDRFAGKVIGIDNRAFVNGDSVNEYLHPSKAIDLDTRKAKLTASGEWDNLLDAGIALPNEPDGKDGHIHPDAIDFSYYKTIFKVGTEYFEGIINIKNIKKGKLLKDVTKIRNITKDIVSSYGNNPKSNFLRDASMASILDSGKEVKKESIDAMDIAVDADTEFLTPYQRAERCSLLRRRLGSKHDPRSTVALT